MSIEVSIQDGPLPTNAPALAAPAAGAVLRFDGVVRPTEADAPIAALRYEVYEPMTSNLLRALAQQIVEAHALTALRTAHSEGDVPVGACSFRLQVAAPHRAEALSAMDAFITRMKRDVPIWKVPVHETHHNTTEPTRA